MLFLQAAPSAHCCCHERFVASSIWYHCTAWDVNTEHRGQRQSLEMQHPWAPFECFVYLSLAQNEHMGSDWSTTRDALNSLKFDYILPFVIFVLILIYSSCRFGHSKCAHVVVHHLFQVWRIAIPLGSHMVGSGCSGCSFCIWVFPKIMVPQNGRFIM